MRRDCVTKTLKSRWSPISMKPLVATPFSQQSPSKFLYIVLNRQTIRSEGRRIADSASPAKVDRLRRYLIDAESSRSRYGDFLVRTVPRILGRWCISRRPSAKGATSLIHACFDTALRTIVLVANGVDSFACTVNDRPLHASAHCTLHPSQKDLDGRYSKTVVRRKPFWTFSTQNTMSMRS